MDIAPESCKLWIVTRIHKDAVLATFLVKVEAEPTRLVLSTAVPCGAAVRGAVTFSDCFLDVRAEEELWLQLAAKAERLLTNLVVDMVVSGRLGLRETMVEIYRF